MLLMTKKNTVLLQRKKDKEAEINTEQNCSHFVLLTWGDLSVLKIKLPMWLIL